MGAMGTKGRGIFINPPGWDVYRNIIAASKGATPAEWNIYRNINTGMQCAIPSGIEWFKTRTLFYNHLIPLVSGSHSGGVEYL